MTANFNTNMPVITPADHSSSGANKIIGTTDNSTHDHYTADDKKGSNDTIDNHNQSSSSSTNHEDHSNMHHQDHSSSSHSMPMMSQGTVMYMDGFHSALFHNSQTPPPCLNFLHPTVRYIFSMYYDLID